MSYWKALEKFQNPIEWTLVDNTVDSATNLYTLRRLPVFSVCGNVVAWVEGGIFRRFRIQVLRDALFRTFLCLKK